MRNYLYIWHDPNNKFIVASGIEFKQIVKFIGNCSGLILLNHNTDNFDFDDSSKFEFVGKSLINKLAMEDIYSWGDFCWVDYNYHTFPKISKQELAEILYFGHITEPLGQVTLPSLNNMFMCYAHDDGWFSKIYYSSWNNASSLINTLEPPFPFDCCGLLNGLKLLENAFWVSNGIEEKKKKH